MTPLEMVRTCLTTQQQADHIANIYHDILAKCELFETAYQTAHLALTALENPTVVAQASHLCQNAFPKMKQACQEIDCLKASLGAQVLNYLMYSKGRADALSKAIYPDSESQRNTFENKLVDQLACIDPNLFALPEVKLINVRP